MANSKCYNGASCKAMEVAPHEPAYTGTSPAFRLSHSFSHRWRCRMKGKRRNPLWKILLTVSDTDECIVWAHTRLPGPREYGEVRYEGKLWLVHRVSFLLHRGPIPEGLDICHSCDNPPCWNPRH